MVLIETTQRDRFVFVLGCLRLLISENRNEDSEVSFKPENIYINPVRCLNKLRQRKILQSALRLCINFKRCIFIRLPLDRRFVQIALPVKYALYFFKITTRQAICLDSVASEMCDGVLLQAVQRGISFGIDCFRPFYF